MYTAHDIAIFIINWCNERRVPISNLKLQKLLYFIQGETSKYTNERFINDDFYAWQLGPVIPTVYYDYAMYSSSPIPRQNTNITIESGDQSKMDQILFNYSGLSTWTLVEKSHNQDPWKYNYTIFGDKTIIPYQSIKDYFNRGEA